MLKAVYGVKVLKRAQGINVIDGIDRYTNELFGKFSKLNDQQGIYPFTEGIKKKSQSTFENKSFQLVRLKATVFSSITNGF